MIYNFACIVWAFGKNCDLVCCLKLGLLIRRYYEQGSSGQISKSSWVLNTLVQSMSKHFKKKKKKACRHVSCLVSHLTTGGSGAVIFVGQHRFSFTGSSRSCHEKSTPQPQRCDCAFLMCVVHSCKFK